MIRLNASHDSVNFLNETQRSQIRLPIIGSRNLNLIGDVKKTNKALLHKNLNTTLHYIKLLIVWFKSKLCLFDVKCLYFYAIQSEKMPYKYKKKM